MTTNTLLTIDMVTNEALRILHQKLNFVGSINRQYDSSFAKKGAKIGTNLRVKLPPRYSSTASATYSANDTTETYVNVPCATQRHIGMDFTSKELTMDIDSFAEEFLEPAMAQLAADMESDAFNMYKDVYAQVGTAGTVPNSFKTLAQAAGKIRENGLVGDDSLTAILNVDSHIELSDALKALQNPSKQIGDNYKKGMIVNETGGFKTIYENTMIPVHTNGTQGGTPVMSGDSSDGDSTIAVSGVTSGGIWKKGTVFTIDTVNSVHPETRQDTGKLHQFTVTADITFTDGTGTVSVSPTIQSSGNFQNVSALPATSDGINLVGAASTGYAQNLAFHKDAFAFVTADLVKPTGSVEFCSQKNYDGLSMRILRQYDARTDEFITRADVLYGYATLRPELAARITA